MAVTVPTGQDLLDYMHRQDLPVGVADEVMTAVAEWMAAHLQVDPYTAVHRRAALAAGKNSVASVASPGGVNATDVGLIFIGDRDVDIRRCVQLHSLGGFA